MASVGFPACQEKACWSIVLVMKSWSGVSRMNHLPSFGVLFGLLAVLPQLTNLGGAEIQTEGRLPGSSAEVTLWWTLSSAAKVLPDQPPTAKESGAVQLRAARNEWESVQVVVRPARALSRLSLTASPFTGPGPAAIPTGAIDLLRAEYLNVTAATDQSTRPGLWPDPLIPVRGPLDLSAGTNHAFWLRVHVPKDTSPGVYHGKLAFQAEGWVANVPLELTVYGFQLPDQMTCQTAFGFSPGEVFRYQDLKTDQEKRQVLDKYWADLAAHHISPYDPAPLDAFKVSWPEVRPPKSAADLWPSARRVEGEAHSGKGSLLVYDDKSDANVVVSYDPLIRIPIKGLHLRGWYRTAVPGHRFLVSLNHYDANRQWLSGRNRDMVLAGNGSWQNADFTLTEFPTEAAFVRLNLMATEWTDGGEKIGLVWFDDISVQDAGTGEELIQGGDFEPKHRTELCAPAEQLKATFDFSNWDRAMERALTTYHFNSFSVPIPGMGGGTFHELAEPNLLGFEESAPEYPWLLGSYCRQLEAHLRTQGWLAPAFIYWFDEPSEDQFPYLQNGFGKLKKFCPDIARMITKRVEPGLIGGPNLWCPISNEYVPGPSEARRQLGERLWWYVCTGPKAPYAGLFLDHRAPEMRLWLWQTFQRNITGILVWQINYWTSETAYPGAQGPQNPYADPMSWTSGYGTPEGKRLPWGNGDGRFIYPPTAAAAGHPKEPILDGPVDSIRWEQLRDGIEDYEYLVLLRKKLEQNRAKLTPELRNRYEQLLAVPEDITKSMTEFAPNGQSIELRREAIARALEQK